MMAWPTSKTSCIVIILYIPVYKKVYEPKIKQIIQILLDGNFVLNRTSCIV